MINIRNIVEVVKNVDDDPHVRRDASEALSILVEKRKGLNVITDEDIRDFLDIAVDNEEYYKLRDSALNYLSLLMKRGRVLNIITDENISSLLETAINERERSKVRESALNFILELSDYGKSKEIIYNLSQILKREILKAGIKENELSDWEKNTMERLEEKLKDGTITNYEKLFLLVLKREAKEFQQG